MVSRSAVDAARTLWAEIEALKAKIEFDQPKQELLRHASEIKRLIETVLDDIDRKG